MTYAVARVATGYGMDPRAVAGWDWLDVLIWGAALDDVERVEAIGRHGEAVTAAALQAQAFHDPKRLRDAQAGVRRLARLPVHLAPEAVQDAAQAILDAEAKAERIARRKRQRGEHDPILTVIRGD